MSPSRTLNVRLGMGMALRIFSRFFQVASPAECVSDLHVPPQHPDTETRRRPPKRSRRAGRVTLADPALAPKSEQEIGRAPTSLLPMAWRLENAVLLSAFRKIRCLAACEPRASQSANGEPSAPTVKRFEARTFLGSHANGTLAVAFLPGGKQAISSGVDDKTHLGCPFRRSSKGVLWHADCFQSIAVTPDGKFALTPHPRAWSTINPGEPTYP
jgi:hypothetical protein